MRLRASLQRQLEVHRYYRGQLLWYHRYDWVNAGQQQRRSSLGKQQRKNVEVVHCADAEENRDPQFVSGEHGHHG
jgi:hypothetical protein